MRQDLREILNSTDKLNRLNNQLLSLARIEEERQEASILNDQVDLVLLVHEVVAEWVPKSLDKNIDLGIEINVNQLLVSGQGLMIEELLNNLLDNALEYNPEWTKVTVKLSQTSGLAQLIVEDNGKGIPVAEQEKVFQRFYRVLGNRNANGGCGLGLAIAQEVMALHHGQVYLKFTDTVGHSGTSIICEFPLLLD
jgi:two-component system sensor histidine kinase TctE